jgi:hypothetical protein
MKLGFNTGAIITPALEKPAVCPSTTVSPELNRD